MQPNLQCYQTEFCKHVPPFSAIFNRRQISFVVMVLYLLLRGLQARGKTFIFHFAVNFPYKPWRHLIAADNVHYLHQAFSLLELSSV